LLEARPLRAAKPSRYGLSKTWTIYDGAGRTPTSRAHATPARSRAGDAGDAPPSVLANSLSYPGSQSSASELYGSLAR
jgi:hypothetical protein